MKMHTIEIDETVWSYLQKHAEPFVDPGTYKSSDTGDGKNTLILTCNWIYQQNNADEH